MSIARIHEDPRVTLPYTDGQWQRIDALGDRVDAAIRSQDIRLTMGGEPTLISIDNMDGDEWSYAATGPEKRLLAGRLIDRLRVRFAPGALLHFGTGKWYPGEPLPRWSLSCCWRKDGVAMWHDNNLRANEEDESHFGSLDAQRFVETLASRLGVDAQYSNPAFEDPFYYTQRERQLPVNVDPVENHLEDAGERDRLRSVFERGLHQPTGFVLPLQRAEGKNGPEWQSGLWMLRGRHLYLVPGDSPIGLRLPLPSLPWVAPGELPPEIPVDPMVTRGRLPSPARIAPPDSVSRKAEDRDRRPAVGESAPWVVRTALCVEPRNGHLYVFMPPLPLIDNYLELLTAIEDTAAHLGMP